MTFRMPKILRRLTLEIGTRMPMRFIPVKGQFFHHLITGSVVIEPGTSWEPFEQLIEKRNRWKKELKNLKLNL